tara:strand:+ start:201 stop:464 length:264 start_codon:yes stop_codon:yes gene_type:complete
MNEYGNLYGPWEDKPDEIDILDTWFESKAWKCICTDAENGCKDSEELMENISEHLRCLIFHLQNESPKSRVDYELRLFSDRIKDFLE